jgi:hypothetical protein
MPRRHNKTGRSKTGRFVLLPHYMLGSPAWRALSPVARAMLVEVLALYNGSNNGRIALSARVGGERVCCSKDTAARALAELQRAGFLELSIQGAFHRKTPHASEWRVTLYQCDRTGEPSSKAFMQWNSPSQNLKRGPTTGTAGPCGETVTPKFGAKSALLSLTSDR